MKEKRDWNQVFKEWEASGMTVTDYCKDRHISVAAFYKNKKVLKNKEDDQPIEVAFTRINVQELDSITFAINDIIITCNRNDVQVFLEAFK